MLPPITRIVGLSAVKLHILKPSSLLPKSNSRRIGEPVKTALPSGRYEIVSGKLQQIFVASLIAILLARPGVISDSCVMTGIPLCAAARTTGTDTKPPFENTISGFIFFISFRDSP